MTRKLIGALMAAALCLQGGAAFAAADYKIVTANEKGTYFAIGVDLAKFVAPEATINLDVLPTAGSAANIKHLRYDLGVKFAIVQADVYQAFIDRAVQGSKEASGIIRPLRVILPLYNTEIHYIVRADSPMNYLHDIKDAKINGGELGSGAALITHTLYRMMFKGPVPEAQDSFLPNQEALVKLIGDKSVDVVVVAAGQPAPLISNMKPEAQKFIKLLKFDPNHPSSKLPVEGRLHDRLGGSLPGDLRLQPPVHRGSPDPVCAILVPEFSRPAGAGPSQMERSQFEPARSRSGLDLLSAHDERDPRLHRRQGACKTLQKMLGGGAHPGILQLIFRNSRDLTASVYSVRAASNVTQSGRSSPASRPMPGLSARLVSMRFARVPGINGCGTFGVCIWRMAKGS